MSTCAVDGCEKPSRCRGWCRTHYSRWQRGGTTEMRRQPRTAMQDAQRFESKVEKSDGCWIWTGTILVHAHASYGQFHAQRKRHLAHRFAYELWVEPIPPGYEVDHVYSKGCRSTLCVNPDHLEAVTPLENQLRQVTAPAARNRVKTHCLRGHPFDADNTSYNSKGRSCRACARAHCREHRRKRKAAA